MNKNIIVVVAIVALLVGGYFLYQATNKAPEIISNSQRTNQTFNTAPVNETRNETQVTASKIYEVTYTDTGYSPSSLTIKLGDTVTFKNESSHQMWTASGMHPVHAGYSGTSLQEHCPDTANTSFDECKNDDIGTSWSFTFTKVGTFGYHDHVKSNHFGKIVVE